MGWRNNYSYYSRSTRRGILLLMICMFAVSAATYLCKRQRAAAPTPDELEAWKQSEEYEEYKAFMQSLQDAEQAEKRTHDYYRDERQPSGTLFPFDPNRADSADFRRLGLPGWMARNILRYREKGGKFRRAEDFRKIYGLTEEQYTRLAPYIRLSPADTMRQKPIQLLLSQEKADTLARIEKYPAGTVVELNGADTTELKKIPGIGSGIARLIVGYRQRLGGFCRIDQLREINLDYEQLRPWLRVDTAQIRRINLNRTGVERLRSHPYFDFYQAKAIVEWRKRNGKLRNLKPFVLYEEFTEADFERMRPYVCFE